MARFTDTIAALATPAGTSAIAVLRVSGPDTEPLAAELFAGPPPPRTVHRADYRDRGGVLVDDVLFTFFRGPQSYTGEDVLEVSCHGNPFIAQKILEDLFARGCRPAEPGEFTQRAFLAGRMDLSQAEAVMDLIHARSERALAVANQQLRGALGRKMSEIVERLLATLARIEAYIDFPEEDLPKEDRDGVVRALEEVRMVASKLLATNHYGEILREGIKTVIVGETNAGKSSLLNRLVGHERAIVSPEPGTTRDYIEERIALGSHSVRLIDTAGLNPEAGELERLGIERTLSRCAEADLILLVCDATKPPPALPDGLRTALHPKNTLVVINKTDLVKAPSTPLVRIPDLTQVEISALTGEGFAKLQSSIADLADRFRIDTGDETVAINARHAHALESGCASLVASKELLAESGALELVASELRVALSAFEEIAGRIDNERMLDHLFSTFCIGK